jgi:hypothetical protein
VDLTSEYCHLVAQRDDLDGEVGVRAKGEPDQLKDAVERPVELREGHRRMLAPSGERRQSPAHGRGWPSRHRQAETLSPRGTSGTPDEHRDSRVIETGARQFRRAGCRCDRRPGL